MTFLRGPFGLLGVLLVALPALSGCLGKGDVKNDASEIPETPAWVVPSTLPKIDAKTMLTELEDFVTKFPQRQGNKDGHKGAREHLAKEFADAGLEVFRQKFKKGIDQENICAVKMGSHEPDVWVVVGGHYDTTTWDSIALGANAPGALASQGAYDDGSGTRITVALAKAFAKIDTYYSVLFCAFDGEERGLEGSKALFNLMGDSSKFPYNITDTRAMLDLDMFGICWPVRAPIYLDQNHPEVLAWVDKARKDLQIPDDMFKDSGVSLGQSDYAHWFSAGIPTAFFISNFEELAVPTPVPNPAPVPGVPGAYPFWHWVDTVETMTAMAGSPDMLQGGFQTALDLSVATLSLFALHPEVKLEPTK